ncbi:grasp-with-spasm system ATP-grasp peptide maturase [Spartinivicinus poritis]|uniref:Grasp-with-spasm system ATP-grasp peptide maturase n=1 Tax=Spartinivicinus poritis TaxID=2994640 RepID=A0ABT5UHX6_9GAMM|nr:grasp-with-spasm system ATP-grasp peptide maturase [Spartinivicinus sp. A2-2]MDE1465043.1 grasp-with-spasm system ATP-grasp peptide maturase [Spartinivicinus sp. A2-2]
MIIIVSNGKAENETEEVLEWLSYMGEDVNRINGTLTLESNLEIELANNTPPVKISIDNRNCDLSNIKSIWFRRWNPTNLIKKSINNEDHTLKRNQLTLNNHVKHFIESEHSTLRNFLFTVLKQNANKVVDHVDVKHINRISVQLLAISIGLKTPKTLICNSKNDLYNFINKNNSTIIKAMGETFTCYLENEEILISSYTTRLTQKLIAHFEEKIFPVLAQEEVEKEFEIRTFFLNNKCYSMAIFSQENTASIVDFRAYSGNEVPYRMVPYKLDEDIENKINILMKNLNLSTGSLDFIKTRNNDLVFLEVNPVGKFGMVSKPCNYFLEKKLAQYLAE